MLLTVGPETSYSQGTDRAPNGKKEGLEDPAERKHGIPSDWYSSQAWASIMD